MSEAKNNYNKYMEPLQYNSRVKTLHPYVSDYIEELKTTEKELVNVVEFYKAIVKIRDGHIEKIENQKKEMLKMLIIVDRALDHRCSLCATDIKKMVRKMQK